MRLCTINVYGLETGAVVTKNGVITISTINKKFNMKWKTNLLQLIQEGEIETLNKWYSNGGKEKIDNLESHTIPLEKAEFGPLYRKPEKILGIGLNYVDHAADLDEKAPNTEPASFFKPSTTIIGPNDNIQIPHQSNKTTGESELAIIFGKECKDVERENWLDVVAGFTTAIDMTAEDILRKNPRYLTRAKSFDTFFSFGPQLVTPDEVKDILKLKVATVINGKIHAQNLVSNMTFLPDYLVSFHTKVMKMMPGDIISTGTPRAVQINNGDIIECQIDGFQKLVNPVIKKQCK